MPAARLLDDLALDPHVHQPGHLRPVSLLLPRRSASAHHEQARYAPRGERLVDAAPFGHWNTTTFVGALTAGGFIAPLVIDGGVNGDIFLAYVRRVLVPELRAGDVVAMDDLGSHKVGGVAEAIAGAGSCTCPRTPRT